MTKLLNLIEKTLDQSPFAVAPSVVRTRLLPVFARRNDWDRPPVNDKGDEVITIKGALAQDIFPDLLAQQGLALGTLMAFTTGQNEPQGIPQPIDLAWILVLKPPRLRPNAGASCPPFF